MKDIDTAIEALRSFALVQMIEQSGPGTDITNREHFAAFAHLCTAALRGEAWAVERMTEALRAIDNFREAGRASSDSKLVVIKATDVVRPDGAIARKIEGV